MKNIKDIITQIVMTTNFDALRITLKGDCSIREIKSALRRQDEIKPYWKQER